MPRFELNFKIMLTVYNTYEGGGGAWISLILYSPTPYKMLLLRLGDLLPSLSIRQILLQSVFREPTWST